MAAEDLETAGNVAVDLRAALRESEKRRLPGREAAESVGAAAPRELQTVYLSAEAEVLAAPTSLVQALDFARPKTPVVAFRFPDGPLLDWVVDPGRVVDSSSQLLSFMLSL